MIQLAMLPPAGDAGDAADGRNRGKIGGTDRSTRPLRDVTLPLA